MEFTKDLFVEIKKRKGFFCRVWIDSKSLADNHVVYKAVDFS